MQTEALRTPAWLLIGLGNEPGMLELVDGRLAFTTIEGRVFDVPLSEVQNITFPWYYFGGGVKFRVEGEQYKVSFVRPNGAQDVPGQLFARTDIGGAAGDAVALLTAGRKIVDVGQGRKAGKAWRAALAGSDAV
jgi:hypothetical protein